MSTNISIALPVLSRQICDAATEVGCFHVECNHVWEVFEDRVVLCVPEGLVVAVKHVGCWVALLLAVPDDCPAIAVDGTSCDGCCARFLCDGGHVDTIEGCDPFGLWFALLRCGSRRGHLGAYIGGLWGDGIGERKERAENEWEKVQHNVL